ncbi:hypothetical protein ACTXL6_16680 [Brachybacterium tyrofermentans]|uniref:hypothetical protein n=1 Tax=Brachybacterium tyrofermentans TaxID=47848 RepID=UPI003FD056AB
MSEEHPEGAGEEPEDTGGEEHPEGAGEEPEDTGGEEHPEGAGEGYSREYWNERLRKILNPGLNLNANLHRLLRTTDMSRFFRASSIDLTGIASMSAMFPTTSTLASLEHIAPRSSAIAAIANSAVMDLLEQRWLSAANPLGSFVTNWLSHLELPDFRGILAALERRVIPDNLAELGITEEDLESIAEVLHDGIPLFWVPRARIAARLIAAQTTAARRTIIGRELPAIVEDCLETLELISNETYFYEADRLREAAELLLSHPTAAQALATATLDSLMYRIARETSEVFILVTSDGGRSKDGHEEMAREQIQHQLGKRGSLVLAPVRPIYQQFKPRGAETPRALNKHASFHRVHPFQYSKRNAAISLMLGTSVLLYMSRWFDGELRQARQRAERTT